MYHRFSIADTIRASWRVLKKNFISLLVYSFISLVISGILDLLKDIMFIGEDRMLILLVWLFFQLTIQAFLTLSFYKLILTLIDREYYDFSFRDILPSFRMTFNFVLIALAYMVVVVLLLLVLDPYIQRVLGGDGPILTTFKVVELGIMLYLLLRAIFCICFIVDDDSAPFESLRQSFEITKDNFFNTLGMLAIVIVFMILALIPIFIIFILCGFNEDSSVFAQKLMFYCWFLLSFPVVQVMIMETYRKLVYSHQDVDDDVSETD